LVAHGEVRAEVDVLHQVHGTAIADDEFEPVALRSLAAHSKVDFGPACRGPLGRNGNARMKERRVLSRLFGAVLMEDALSRSGK
jgi:hypothetical protein